MFMYAKSDFWDIIGKCVVIVFYIIAWNLCYVQIVDINKNLLVVDITKNVKM